MGPFARWLEQIVAEDHELVVAALAQLCLQKQPVTCEYRVQVPEPPAPVDPALRALLPPSQNRQVYRWVRDTLTPHYSDEGLVDGWEGLVEEITEQRALSQNLRKITNMLQVLITNLPTGVFFVQAPMGYPILVNARARQLLGQREDMSAGLSHLSRIYRLHRPDGTEYPSDELPIAKAACGRAITCRANDIVVHRADGRKIPLIAWAAPIDLHNTGVPDAAVWVLEDLSAMRQAETALRESEVRLRAIIETMGEGVIVQDKAGTIIECNPAASAILNTPREELLNRSGLVPHTGCLAENGDLLAADHPDQRALRDTQPVRGVIVGMPAMPGISAAAPTGVRWLLVNAMPLPVGPSVGLNHQRARVVTTFADITEHLRFQESLRHAMQKYQTLVETLPFMMIQQDLQGNITYLNPATVQLTGYAANELLAPGFFAQITSPEDRPIFQAATELVADGKSTRVELRLLTHAGVTKSVLVFIYPNLQDEKVIGSTSLVIDMTTQRRLEEELLRAKHLELVGKLASGTVHDFNNLLAVMMSLAELAKMEVPAEHSAGPYLTRLIDVGEKASHLAGQILAFVKQRSKIQQAVDLNATVSQTVRMLQSVIPANFIVETYLAPELPAVSGNENQLKQVLMNLCLNARDAMPQGGRLTIRTDLAAPPENSPTPSNSRRWVHLSIQDTGQGMDENTRLRIFEPFFSTKERGTGLGLAVVHQIINECGGLIVVGSQAQRRHHHGHLAGRKRRSIPGSSFPLLPLVASLRFQVLEVSELRDRRLDDGAHAGVLDLAGDGRNHLIPFTDDLRQLVHVAMVPVVALVMHLDLGKLVLLHAVQQGDDRRVTAHEIRQRPRRPGRWHTASCRTISSASPSSASPVVSLLCPEFQFQLCISGITRPVRSSPAPLPPSGSVLNAMT